MISNLLKVCLFAILCSRVSVAQSQTILTENEYLDQVKKYHPVINKSGLVISNSIAELKAAKSEFDPTIDIYYDDKKLKERDYFSYNEGNIKLNTISPFSISTGYLNNRGELINPETTTGFITYFGVNLPLLKGLLMDDRRAELAKAKVNINLSETEQKLMINDLLFDASNNYSYWLNSFLKLRLTNQYVNVIQERIKLNNITFQNGDKSVADTLEMYTQLQAFKIQQQAALMEYVSNTIKLSAFLWKDNGEPYLLSDEYNPDTTALNDLFNTQLNIEFVASSTPFINYYKYKLEQLEIDEKLKRQSLLPMLALNSKYYSADRNTPLNISSYPVVDNYFVGLNFKYTLFNRNAKANLEMIRIKMRENNLNREQKSWELNTKALENLNEWERTKNQIVELNSLKSNLAKLLSIEQLKFREGESSIFLINARESKLIETDLKTVDTFLKLNQVYNKYRWLNANYIN